MTTVGSPRWAARYAAARARYLAVVTLQLLFCSSSASACIWDRDTLSAEAIGLPEVIDVIVGRFDRPPAKFYEIRLRVVTELLRKEPDNWALYDDAGAAADRLHRDDEAIGWMARKRSSLERTGATDAAHNEHTYRYHANLGTFHAHRWLRAGAKRDRLEDLTLARKHIAEAIRLNPQAHFGRERYQLMAIEWLLVSPDPQKDRRASSLFWAAREQIGPGVIGKPGANQLSAAGYGDAVRGLTGLIVLGDAWQSIDIHLALAQALNDQGNIAAAKLAMNKVRVLLESGRRSLLAGNDNTALEQIEMQLLEGNPYTTLSSFYREATAAAESRQVYRDTYVQERLDAGRHPDSDTSFWKSYVEPPALRLQAKEKLKNRTATVAGAIFAIVVALPLSIQWRRRRQALEAPQNGATDDVDDGEAGFGTVLASLIWIGLVANNGLHDDSVAPTTWLFLLSPLLLTLAWWTGYRLMGFPRWSRGVALRHLGYAAMIWMIAGVALVALNQRPNYHVEWKLERLSSPGTGRVP